MKTGDRPARTQSPGGRSQSPNGRRAFDNKFRFSGCWHCGSKDHSRKANPAKGIKGCPAFEKIKDANGGRPPQGYKGAYEKARDLAWEKAKAKRPSKVNALDDTDDEDFSDDDSNASTGCFALTVAPERPNFLHANPFDELADENEEGALARALAARHRQ